jgi:hypothetical protein
MHGHGLLAADHHRLVEVGIDDFALVERHLNPLPICVKVLIGADNAVRGNGLPSFGEALLFKVLIHGSVGGEFFFLFFLPFDVEVKVGSGAPSSSSRSACSSSSSSTSWLPSRNP